MRALVATSLTGGTPMLSHKNNYILSFAFNSLFQTLTCKTTET